MANKFWQDAHRYLQDAEQLLSRNDSATQREELLERRALQFAERSRDKYTETSHAALLTFTVSGERYAVAVEHIRNVTKVKHITPVPCVPRFYRGVANINGRIITLLDLAAFFEVSTADSTTAQQHVIVVAGQNLSLAILVDEVGTLTDLHQPIELLPEQDYVYPYVTTILADGVAVLDLDSLLTDPRLYIDEEPR